MRLMIRMPGMGPTAWTQEVAWPDGWRVPMAGEMVCIDRGQFEVETVQWFREHEEGRLIEEVQVIVR